MSGELTDKMACWLCGDTYGLDTDPCFRSPRYGHSWIIPVSAVTEAIDAERARRAANICEGCCAESALDALAALFSVEEGETR